MKSLKLVLTITILLSSFLLAQEKEIKNIKGEVEKIVIVTSEGETVIEGEAAKKIIAKLKSKGNHFTIKKIGDGGESLIFIGEDDAALKEFEIRSLGKKGMKGFAFGHGEKGTNKNVNVEIVDGEKIVTVTTVKDGEETVEVFEGDEAEEWLVQHKPKKEQKMLWVTSEDSDAEKVFIIKKELSNQEEGVEKKIDIEIEDGKKKVTVTTIKDGEETEEVFEGEEAEKWLEENERSEHGEHLIWVSEDDHHNSFSVKKMNKIILEELHGNGEMNIKIDVDENDNMKIIIKEKDEDGNVTEKVYEGEEAKKYLKEHKGKGEHIMFFSDDDSDCGEKKQFKVKVMKKGDKEAKEIKIRKVVKEKK